MQVLSFHNTRTRARFEGPEPERKGDSQRPRSGHPPPAHPASTEEEEEEEEATIAASAQASSEKNPQDLHKDHYADFFEDGVTPSGQRDPACWKA
ncbi:hypothetical protein MMC17_001268 [Xylographa soralifera]|nr:hypothetical protein [Xylographa soralifera]